ncbi:MAG: PPC domain-containing DNA-binding protein [Beijerinckiaceae bacterium]
MIQTQAAGMLPRARTLVHPGAFNAVRIKSLSASRARHVRLLLMPGMTLHDALVRPLVTLGIENASTTILGGGFASLQYCVAPPDPTGSAVIAYSKPIDAGAAVMIFGNATIGKSMCGEPLVHCHATIRTASGTIKGGHIMPQATVVGDQPVPVLVTSLDGFELRQAFDPETNIPLLQPFREADDTQRKHHAQ